MEIKVVKDDVTQLKVPALVVNLFKGVKSPGGANGATGAVDKALDGAISQLIEEGEIKGNKGEHTLIHTFGKIAPARVLVLGLGKPDGFDQNTVREVMAGACRYLRRLGVEQAATIAHGSGIAGLDARNLRGGHRRGKRPGPLSVQELPLQGRGLRRRAQGAP